MNKFVRKMPYLFVATFMLACGKPPVAPTGLTIEKGDDFDYYLSWNEVPNATFYDIEHNGRNGGGTSQTYFKYYALDEGDHTFRVKATNYHGESPYSSYYHYTVSNDNGGGGGNGGGSSSISAPTGVSAEVSGSRVCVTWNSISNASYYKVYRASSSSGSYSVISSSTSNTYYYDSSPSTNNYYKVTAVNSSGTESEKSDYAYCYYSSGGGGGGTSAPDAPTGVNAENVGNAMLPDIKISWNSVSNATSYKVYRSTSASGSYSQIGMETTLTFLNDNNPRQGKNYYKVKAFNSAGGSSYSSYAMYNYDPSSQLSPCPVNYTSHTATSTTITLRWNNPTSTGCGTPTTAYLRVRHPDSGDYVTLETLSGSASSVSFSYGMWANSEGYVYCGIITENSAGSSGGVPLVYNWKTNTWYGGKGLELTGEMEKEWEEFSK